MKEKKTNCPHSSGFDLQIYLTSTTARLYEGKVRVNSPPFRLRSTAEGISAARLSS